MHYVVLDVQIDSSAVKPVLLRLGYQVVDPVSLEARNEPYVVDVDGESIKEFIAKLDEDLKSHATVANHQESQDGSQNGSDVEKEFVFCTLNPSWSVKVGLVSSANDLGVELPEYLRYPVFFDIWKEYSIWKKNHSDSSESPQTQANGESIDSFAGKIEELVRTLDVSTEYDELKQKNDDPTFEVRLATLVLTALHKKCVTPVDDTTVLTVPYDLGMDYKNFIEEQSKILYISNIPSELNQTDLEGWFQQKGVASVGFWTLKNISDDATLASQRNHGKMLSIPDSMFGFAIFQSHNDAEYALNLHGTVMKIVAPKGNKHIEQLLDIQPSSMRLLEKVQDNLILLPQNKNKPRPGDWNCPSCGFSNFQRRTACFRCAFPVPNGVSGNAGKLPMTSVTNNMVSGYTNYNTRNLNNKSNWNNLGQDGYQYNQQQQLRQLQQMQQTYQMYAANRASNNGGKSPIQSSYRSSYNGGQSGNSSYNMPLHNYNRFNQGTAAHLPYNLTHSTSSNGYISEGNNHGHGGMSTNSGMIGGSNVPFRAGDWKCPGCFYHNFAKNIVCLRCGGPKTKTTTRDKNNQDGDTLQQEQLNQTINALAQLDRKEVSVSEN